MSRRARVVALAGLLLALVSASASAAGKPKVAERMAALDKSALAELKAGHADKAKEQLMEAMMLGKENGLRADPAMALTYLDLGVVHVDGLKDAEAGVRYFGMALKLSPKIQVGKPLATKAVMAAFEQARAGHGSPAAGEKAIAAKAADADDDEKAGADDEKTEKTEKSEAAVPAPKPPAQPAAAPAKAKPAAPASSPAIAEDTGAAKAESARLAQDLARAKDGEKAARAEAERLKKDAQEKDKQLAEAREAAKKERAAKDLVQKEKAETDKQLAAARAELATARAEIAAARDREAKDKDARERLGKEKVEADKQLAAAREREAKEKDAKERLEKERLQAEAREKERKGREESERHAKEKVAEGPDLPAHIPQPLHCPAPDESRAGEDLFIHCAAQPTLKADAIVLHYRSAGVAEYNTLVMERSRKGWYTAMVPAAKLTGKALQYYAEARTNRGGVAASTGKADSPNIMLLRPAGAALASAPAPASAPAKLVPARAVTTKARPARSATAGRAKGK